MKNYSWADLLAICFILSQHGLLQFLDFLYICAYIELLTVAKFAPQVYLHFQRKSTIGWSITTVFFDLIGGISSILQMIVISYNENDWSSFIGNPTKFGAGLLSILFDIVFILQHFVFYRQKALSKMVTLVWTYIFYWIINSLKESSKWNKNYLTLKLKGFWEVSFREMKFALSNFLSNEDLSISYESWANFWHLDQWF